MPGADWIFNLFPLRYMAASSPLSGTSCIALPVKHAQLIHLSVQVTRASSERLTDWNRWGAKSEWHQVLNGSTIINPRDNMEQHWVQQISTNIDSDTGDTGDT